MNTLPPTLPLPLPGPAVISTLPPVPLLLPPAYISINPPSPVSVYPPLTLTVPPDEIPSPASTLISPPFWPLPAHR